MLFFNELQTRLLLWDLIPPLSTEGGLPCRIDLTQMAYTMSELFFIAQFEF